MGVFKLGKMTFGSLFKKPETVKYPFETKPQPQGLKGQIVLDAGSCILCGMCEKSCPTDCITVDKANRTWSLVPFQCIQCGYCTQVCPKKCLAMDPNYWAPATAKGANTVVVPEVEKASAKPIQNAEPQTAVEKPAEKQQDAFSTKEVAEIAQAVDATIDSELEAKLALMDAGKAECVRKALSNR